jgi:hypothetical protein
MTAVPPVLFVAWQDPVHRRILPVARIVVDERGEYEFAYVRAVEAAQASGFLPLVSFPDLKSVYRSQTLMPILHNRLVQPNRPEYREHLLQLGLAPVVEFDPFAILARSGGRRVTDRLELFAPPTDYGLNRLSCYALVRGVRYKSGSEQAIAQIKAGDHLTVSRDAANPVNPKALELRHGGVAIGYLPDYLASELSCAPEEIDVLVRRVNLPPAPVHYRVLIEVTFPASGPRPFSGPDYLPLSSDASTLAA